MEKVFRGVPLDPEEFLTSLTELRIAGEGMEFIRGMFLYFILFSQFTEYGLLIQYLIRHDDASERVCSITTLEKKILFLTQKTIAREIIPDDIDEIEIFPEEDK